MIHDQSDSKSPAVYVCMYAEKVTINDYINYRLLCLWLLSYKNGSKVREKVRNKCAGGKWDEFSRLLDKTQPGNAGNIGTCTVYIKLRECMRRHC